MPRQPSLFALTPREKPLTWVQEAASDWSAVFGARSAHIGKIGRSLKPLVDEHGWEEVRAAWRRYLAKNPGQFCSPANFREHYALWTGGANLSERDKLFVQLMRGGGNSGNDGDF